MLGKNSFSFNRKNEKADEMNSNYIKVIKQNDTNISFKANDFICFAGNLAIEDYKSNAQTNYSIVNKHTSIWPFGGILNWKFLHGGKYPLKNPPNGQMEECLIVKEDPDIDGKYKIGNKNGQQRRKIVLISVIVTIIVVIALVIIPFLKRKDINHIEIKVFTNTTHGCAEDTMTSAKIEGCIFRLSKVFSGQSCYIERKETEFIYYHAIIDNNITDIL